MIGRTFFIMCFILSISNYSYAASYELGLAFDSIMLQGDWDTVSDPGFSTSFSLIRNLNSFVGIGVRTGVERVTGTATVDDSDPIYHGEHEYTALMVPMGIVTRIKPVLSIPFQPYVEGEFGVISWYPDHTGPSWRLPTETVVTSALSPFAGIGGGVIIPFGARWSLDLHGSYRYVFDDRLDSIDSKIIGGASGNDRIVKGGIALVYRFGNNRSVGELPVPASPENTILVTNTDDKSIKNNAGTTADPNAGTDGFMGVSDESQDITGFQAELVVPKQDMDSGSLAVGRALQPGTSAQSIIPVSHVYYTLQAVSCISSSEAQSAAALYKQHGMDVVVSEEQKSALDTSYSVYVGRYESDDEASRAAYSIMEEAGLKNIRIFLHASNGKYIPGRDITADNFYVHVSSFMVQSNALAETKRFNLEGYQAVIRQVDLGEKGVWYRVLVGPYAGKDDASRVASVIKTDGLSDYTAIMQ